MTIRRPLWKPNYKLSVESQKMGGPRFEISKSSFTIGGLSFFALTQQKRFSDRIVACDKKWIEIIGSVLNSGWIGLSPPSNSQKAKHIKNGPLLQYGGWQLM